MSIKSLQPFLFFLAVFFLQCTTVPSVAGQFTTEEFDQMAKKMARGKVPDIQTEELHAHPTDYLLLDTREKAEYDVSHIPGAIWVGYDDFIIERVQHLDKTKPVITYCSVGYRSERIGEKLQKAGFENVQNLEGSIFKWVNQGFPLIDQLGNSTQRVHGYNQRWGKWVKNGVVVYP